MATTSREPAQTTMVTELGRFPNTAEWAAQTQSSCGVTVVPAFESFALGERQGHLARPWGRCWVNDAVFARLDEPSGFIARTAPLSASRGEPRTYYVRVTRADGEQAWSSPLRLTA
jgi:hypothetical protein